MRAALVRAALVGAAALLVDLRGRASCGGIATVSAAALRRVVRGMMFARAQKGRERVKSGKSYTAEGEKPQKAAGREFRLLHPLRLNSETA